MSFLDNLGTVQYFDTDFLRDKVVVDPQWIVNVMACVVSVRASVIQVCTYVYDHICTVYRLIFTLCICVFYTSLEHNSDLS